MERERAREREPEGSCVKYVQPIQEDYALLRGVNRCGAEHRASLILDVFTVSEGSGSLREEKQRSERRGIMETVRSLNSTLPFVCFPPTVVTRHGSGFCCRAVTRTPVTRAEICCAAAVPPGSAVQ